MNRILIILLAVLAKTSFGLKYAADFEIRKDPDTRNAILKGYMYYNYNTANPAMTRYRMEYDIIVDGVSVATMKEIVDYNRSTQYKLCDKCEAHKSSKTLEAWHRLPSDTRDNSDKTVPQCTLYKRGGTTGVSKVWVGASDTTVCRIEWHDGKVMTLKNQVGSFDDTLLDPAHYNCPGAVCRAVIDLVFVLDRSRSVTPNQWTAAKGFVNKVVDQFTIGVDDVMVAVVFFGDDKPGTYSPTSGFVTTKDEVSTALGKTNYGAGYTCIGCGLNKAYDLLNKPVRTMNQQRVIITLTDGVNNLPCGSSYKLKGTKSCDSGYTSVEGVGGEYWCYRHTGMSGSTCTTPNVPMANLTSTADKIHGGSIFSYAVGVVSANAAELKIIASDIPGRQTVFDLAQFEQLGGIVDQLATEACRSGIETSTDECGGACFGFCGCDDKCVCPQCMEDPDKCTSYKCAANNEKAGCVPQPISCEAYDFPKQCLVGVCDPAVGCKSVEAPNKPATKVECQRVVCDSGAESWKLELNHAYCYKNPTNKCEKYRCDEKDGCVDESEDCSLQNTKCTTFTCDSGSGQCVGETTDCSEGDDKCMVHTCDEATGDCLHTEMVCGPPRDACHVAKCVDGVCVEIEQPACADDRDRCMHVTCVLDGTEPEGFRCEEEEYECGACTEEDCRDHAGDKCYEEWCEQLEGEPVCHVVKLSPPDNGLCYEYGDYCNPDTGKYERIVYNTDEWNMPNAPTAEEIEKNTAECKKYVCDEQNGWRWEYQCKQQGDPCGQWECQAGACVFVEPECPRGERALREEDEPCSVYTGECLVINSGTGEVVPGGDAWKCETTPLVCMEGKPCNVGWGCIFDSKNSADKGVCVYAPPDCDKKVPCKRYGCDNNLEEGCWEADAEPLNPDPCMNYVCDPNAVDEEHRFVVTPKCTVTAFCTEPRCLSDGTCGAVPRTCTIDPELARCFKGECDEEAARCGIAIREGAFFDACGECVELGDDLNADTVNFTAMEEECIGGLPWPKFVTAITGAALAGFIILGIVVAALLSAGGVLGTKELLKRGAMAKNQVAVNNPLYEGSDTGGINPLYEGEGL